MEQDLKFPIKYQYRRKDNPEIKVFGDDIDKAVRLLSRRVKKYQTVKILKFRKLNPAPRARKREKRRQRNKS